jgi:ATP-dependent Clp protease ATP-binding subunit ClpA
MKELSGQLAERKVTLELTAAARLHLSEKGYDPDFGARPLARVIQEEVKMPLSNELLFGALEFGGKVTIDAENDKLVFRHVAGEKPPEKPPEKPKEPEKKPELVN